jgi:hypothetical protein
MLKRNKKAALKWKQKAQTVALPAQKTGSKVPKKASSRQLINQSNNRLSVKKGSSSSKSGSRNVSTHSYKGTRNSPTPKKSFKKNNLSTDEDDSLDSFHIDCSNDFHEDLINMVKHIRKTISDLKKMKITGGGYSTKQVMQPTR